MKTNKLFWYGNMAGAVAGWIFILLGLISPFHGGIKTLWLMIAVIWCVAHPLELIISIPIGKKAGFSTQQSIINTLVFEYKGTCKLYSSVCPGPKMDMPRRAPAIETLVPVALLYQGR